MEACYWSLQKVVENEKLAKVAIGHIQMTIEQWDHKAIAWTT